MNVLVIPEDPTYDRFILKPIVEMMLDRLDVPARVAVLDDPHLGGIDEALDPTILREIVEANPMEDLFLLIVDRDCDRHGNVARASAREAEHPGRLIHCLAIEEVEVWMLALHRRELQRKLRVSWANVRRDCDPKDTFANPFLDAMGWAGGVGRGRERAMRELGSTWNSLVKICPELSALARAVETWRKGKAQPS